MYEKLLTLVSKGLNGIGYAVADSDTFNLFTALGVETKEVILCRLLKTLLDPQGSHQMQHLPLYYFVKEVLGYQAYTQEEAAVAEVYTEKGIEKKRRVDLVIETPGRVIPIEVKIWARDQETQLYDYYQYYEEFCDCVFYLTPTGWEPTKESRKDLQIGKQVKLLSFEKDIQKWLKRIEPLCKQKNLEVCIEQFEEVIELMCAESKEERKILEVLKLDKTFEDTDTLRAAIELLKHKDTIEKEIRISYLKKALYFDKEKYQLARCDGDDQKTINDQHTLLKLLDSNNGKPVLWICVETNLYVVAQKVKTAKGSLWSNRSNPEKKYFWQYVSPGGAKKKFDLKNLEKFPKEKIDLTQFLDDVEME